MKKLTMKKAGYGFLIGALAVAALLIAACGDILDQPENGYRVRINLVGEDLDVQGIARTTFPSFTGVTYKYFFTKDNGTEAEEPASSGEFLLAAGSYKLRVEAYSGSNKGAEGNAEFTVPGVSTVTVPLKSAGTANGTLNVTIDYPSGSVPTVTLTKMTDTGLSNTNTTLLPTITQTTYTLSSLSVAPGSYLLSVFVKESSSGKSAGTIEAIHIYPYLTTTFGKTYIFSDMSSLIPIGSVTLSIPEPRQGVASVASSNDPPYGITFSGGYTVTGVAWKNGDAAHSGNFAGGETYSVEITLASNNGYTFVGLTAANAKINGQGATLSANPGDTAKLSYTFAETKTVEGVTVAVQPKLAYTHNDKLDLSALVVKLQYTDKSDSGNIGFADFGKWAITTNLADKLPLTISDHDRQTVTISCNDMTVETNPLTVTAKPASGLTITIADKTYTGDVQEPVVVVKDGDTTLIEDNDYTVGDTNFTNVGEYTVTVTGIGNYKETKTATFKIVPKSISGVTITLVSVDEDNPIPTYDGTAKTRGIETVVDGSLDPLVEGTDYTVAYSDNINAGTNTAKVTITGKGNYKETKTANFSINKATLKLENFDITGVLPARQTYDGTGKAVGATLKAPFTNDGIITITYTNKTGTPSTSPTAPINADTYTVKISVAPGNNFGNLAETILNDLVIDKANLVTADFQAITAKTYTGSAQGVSGDGVTGDIKLVTTKSGIGTISNIRYGSTPISDAPKDAGTYPITVNVASGINFNEATNLVVGSLTINKVTPVAGDFTFTPPTDATTSSPGNWSIIGNGTPRAITIALTSPKTGAGAITVRYTTTTTTSTTAPSATGVYTVTFDVAAGTNYNAASGLTAGTLTIQ